MEHYDEDQAERLQELLEDSPMNDEPLTPEQEARVDQLIARLKHAPAAPPHRPYC